MCVWEMEWNERLNAFRAWLLIRSMYVCRALQSIVEHSHVNELRDAQAPFPRGVAV